MPDDIRPSKASPLEPGDPEEVAAVTGRPNDIPLRGEDKPAVPNSTFADRVKAREASEKRIASASNKAVQPDDAKTKRARR